MSRFRHIGGDVFDTCRKLDLSDAVQLVGVWGRIAIACDQAGRRDTARLYARLALSLHIAATAAMRWRRCAGWADPFAADRAAS